MRFVVESPECGVIMCPLHFAHMNWLLSCESSNANGGSVWLRFREQDALFIFRSFFTIYSLHTCVQLGTAFLVGGVGSPLLLFVCSHNAICFLRLWSRLLCTTRWCLAGLDTLGVVLMTCLLVFCAFFFPFLLTSCSFLFRLKGLFILPAWLHRNAVIKGTSWRICPASGSLRGVAVWALLLL